MSKQKVALITGITGDNYHPENSHVIPALIRRFHEAKINHAKEVLIWGTGTPRREFLYVDDMAAASVFVMEIEKMAYDDIVSPMQSHINAGSGSDVTIEELGAMIKEVVGYKGGIKFDSSMPDGAPRKYLDSRKIIDLGWAPRVGLVEGLEKSYSNFLHTHKCAI